MSDQTAISWTDQDLKWCTKCKAKHHFTEFGKDKSRGDGLAAACIKSRSTGNPRGWHGKPNINPVTGRPGPAPQNPRSGDKIQARQRINVEVSSGRRSHPNKLPCVDCGHVWKEGERRHEYDHFEGYGEDKHYEVEAVCTTCHKKRSVERGELKQKRGKGGRFISNGK